MLGLRSILSSVQQNAVALKVLREVGVAHPSALGALSKATKKWGSSAAGSIAAQASLRPYDTAVIDDEGQCSWAELHAQINAVAHALSAAGVRPGDGVGVFCRNSRWFVVADAAASRVGARVLYLNTGFAGAQFTEVLDREGATVVIYDDEFADVVEPHAGDRQLIIAHHDGDVSGDTLRGLAGTHASVDPDPPARKARHVILTSGTTGTPKGAQRPELPPDLVTLASIFSRIPYRSGMTTMIAAPLFHAWGLANYTIATGIGATIVLRRRFDPEATMALLHEHHCEGLVVVPVMMSRMLDLEAPTRQRYDLSALRVTAASGSALPGSLATRWMDETGDNLYNMYGSTEVAMATIATPADMRAAPGTAGKPPLGVTVRLYTDDGRPIVEPDRVGRIFVGNRAQFEGYTGGGGKEVIDGLMSVGDLGRFDVEGRLFVGGRDDDMIVSGGENVFPREVEDLLSDHDSINEAAVIGVDDAEFGSRLKAFVVTEPGAELTERDVKQFVRSRLANYKVPREVVFLDELPRNATGKVLKKELREL